MTDRADTSPLISFFVKLQESMPCLGRHMDVPTTQSNHESVL